MEGILNINKSVGDTSFAVVAAVRRLSRERRVGHAGTLDPLASGVLPVCVGKATRMVEYLLEHPKTYRAVVEFGLTSDSGDADGHLSRGGDPSTLDAPAIGSALGRFKGEILQKPPVYSALKRNGRPLYELARAGVDVDVPARPVRIHALELLSWESPLATIDVTCSRGTYVRSLARDLGEAVGCGAYLKDLCRLKYGPFELAEAISLDQFREASLRGDCSRFLYPIDSVLLHLPPMKVPSEIAKAIIHGQPYKCSELPEQVEGAGKAKGHVRCRAYTLDGCFLGVLRFNSEKDEWQPEKVFL